MAIDPGASTGWALFVDGDLFACGHCVPSLVPQIRVETLVVERPRVRTHGKHRGSAQSVVTLAIELGQAIGRVSHMRLIELDPSDWKGSIPKPSAGEDYIVEARVWRNLRTATERDCARRNATRHDTWDAIGIGMFALGRVGRGIK